MRFDRVAVLDWSAARGPRRGKDSIWLGVAAEGGAAMADNLPTRSAAETALEHLIDAALDSGTRLLIAADFAFGYPAGYARAVTGQADALALWDWLGQRVVEAADHSTSYRAAAAAFNARFAGDGPLWGNGEAAARPGLPRLKPPLPAGLAELRATELAARAEGVVPKPPRQLAGAGAVGAQTLTGIPVMARLRARHPGRVVAWPLEPLGAAPVVLAETYTALLAAEVRADLAAHPGRVPDEAQVRLLAEALARLSHDGALAPLFEPAAPPAVLAEEGWILGGGHAAALRRALMQAERAPD